MIFQTFDDKKDCYAVYMDGKIHSNGFPKRSNPTSTWEYSEFLRDEEVLYAKYYCGGKSLSQACPEHLRSEWEIVSNKLKAFHRASSEAKLDLNEHCFYDLFPPHVLVEYGAVKDRICAHVFKNYEKDINYTFFSDLSKVLVEIKNRKLNVDLEVLKPRRHEFRVRQFIRKIKEISPYIIYDMYGTKTGRLTSKKFPILTMDRSFRKVLKPNNEWFFELDYNAAELRVLLGLLGKVQPQEDIHDWSVKNIYSESVTREEAKKRTFAWLYNPKSKDVALSKIYDRNSVVEEFFDGKQVTTTFNRTIEAGEHHALNYIIQSTAADLFLRQMINVWKYLKDKKSSIAFCLHDSLVIDLHKDDESCVNEIKKIFENTKFGKFKVNSYGGKNFKDMKRLNIL